MPDLVTHWLFAGRVLSALPAVVAERIERPVYDHASAGPDLWFSLGFLGGKKQALSARGDTMHSCRSGAFLLALAEQAKNGGSRDGTFSYLAGYLCHYALDTTAHPYIVYRSGNYDGRPETLRYRGGHMRLERAIDTHMLQTSGLAGRGFSIDRRVLRLRRLPESLRQPLDAAYADVYGWRDAYRALNAAILDQRRFYALVWDPAGVVDALAQKLDDGKSAHDYRVMSYHGRALDPARTDYLNESLAPWHNAFDPALCSRESFADLLARAERRAADLIVQAWRYVYLSAPRAGLASAVGDLDYGTGLPCGDPRINGGGDYAPLF